MSHLVYLHSVGDTREEISLCVIRGGGGEGEGEDEREPHSLGCGSNRGRKKGESKMPAQLLICTE